MSVFIKTNFATIYGKQFLSLKYPIEWLLWVISDIMAF